MRMRSGWGVFYVNQGKMMTALATFDKDYTLGLQKALCEKLCMELTIDGDFGPKSIAALKTFQTNNTLTPSGAYDAATQAVLEPFIFSKFLTRKDYEAAAKDLNVTPAHVRTVSLVESKGAGFLPNGRVKLLFERHKFYGYLSKKFSPGQIKALLGKNNENADIINAQPGGYATGPTPAARGVAEWQRFNRAFQIDAESAMLSASYGLFQVMGFNFADSGFKSVGSFLDAMKISEINQLTAFVSFIKNYQGGRLLVSLKNEDWTEFARVYNGPSYKEYDVKLVNEFAVSKKMYA